MSKFTFPKRLLLCNGVVCAVIFALTTPAVQAQMAPIKAKAGAPELAQSKPTFEPSDKKIALDDCSTPAKGLNQYVITNVMTTSITLSNPTPQELGSG